MHNIRLMSQKDFPQIQLILQNAGSDWTIAVVKDCCSENYSNLVITEGDRVVGLIIVKTSVDAWEILQIVIDKNYQRQGLATQLLAYVIEKSGSNKIQLEVRHSNLAAIALYHRCGFRKVGVRKKYYADGVDAVLMDYRQ